MRARQVLCRAQSGLDLAPQRVRDASLVLVCEKVLVCEVGGGTRPLEVGRSQYLIGHRGDRRSRALDIVLAQQFGGQVEAVAVPALLASLADRGTPALEPGAGILLEPVEDRLLRPGDPAVAVLHGPPLEVVAGGLLERGVHRV